MGASGTERYRRQTSALNDRTEAARATLATLPAPTSGDDLTGLLDLLTAFREVDVIDSTESPWSSWTVEERREFLGYFLAEVTVSKATKQGGGDKVAWSGHERLGVTWADGAPF